MRIALVFPPAMSPISPPLGIAALKPYLESAAIVEVRNFDLNLSYFEQAFQWLGDGRLRMRLKKMDLETTAQRAVAARDFFQGKEGLPKFYDLDSYNGHAGIYAGFNSVLNGLFDHFARKILLGIPVPPLVNGFFDELIGPLKAFRPDLIGFSILFSQQLFFALALAKLCKSSEPPPSDLITARPVNPAKLGLDSDPASARVFGTKIVFGGATFSVMPDPGRLVAGKVPVYLGSDRNEVDTGGLIDYLIVGEGEKGLQSLAKSLISGIGHDEPGSVFRPHSRVPGLVHMKDGKAVRNPAETAIELNALPLPDFSDFPLDKYHSPVPVLPYMTSRGCPWKRCAFCTHQKTYLDYREEDAATTSERLLAIRKKYGVSHFSLVDEMVHPRRLDRIAGHLLEGDAQVHFSAYAKLTGFSPKLLEKAHRAGLSLMMWGLESASRRVLDLMRKGTNIQEIASVLNSAHKAGIWNLLFVIAGFPTETRAEWLSTLDFLDSRRESVDALSRSRFILLEGSEVFSKPQNYGIKRIIDRPQRDPVSIAYDYEVTEGMTQKEVTTAFQESSERLSGIGRSPWFGQFREHMLLFAAGTEGAWSGKREAGRKKEEA